MGRSYGHFSGKAIGSPYKPESRVKRFARWLDNERILEEMYFLPYAEILLTH